MNLGFRFVVFMLGTLYGLSSSEAFCQVDVSTKEAGSNVLTILKPAPSLEIPEFCLQPPDKSDLQVDLSIAAAFTTTTSSISGIAICNGKKVAGPVNAHLEGTVIFIDGNFQIFPNERGKILTPNFTAAVQSSGGSVFQQLLLVKDSKAQTFKGAALAQRRALVVFNKGERGVVQSTKPMTLGQFSRDMQSIGVRHAIYTPVGDGDGGWYRNGDKIVSIGASPSPPIQSNWVVWKKNTSKHDAAAVDAWLKEHAHATGSK